jgi:hypothetical protein
MSTIVDLMVPDLASNPEIQDHILSCPFRSYVSRVHGAPIRAVWVLHDDDAFPLDETMLTNALDELDEGGALLILAPELSIRDRAKHIVSGMMLVPVGAA